MIKQFNNIIMLNRGDSYDFDVHLVDADNAFMSADYYELKGNDAVYFGIMDVDQPFENALVKKKFVVNNLKNKSGDISAGIIHIEILPEDTLDLIPGKYYYSVKVKLDHTDIEQIFEHTSDVLVQSGKTYYRINWDGEYVIADVKVGSKAVDLYEEIAREEKKVNKVYTVINKTKFIILE